MPLAHLQERSSIGVHRRFEDSLGIIVDCGLGFSVWMQNAMRILLPPALTASRWSWNVCHTKFVVSAVCLLVSQSVSQPCCLFCYSFLMLEAKQKLGTLA